MEKLKEGANIYFMGIAGTGMAAVAGLMQEAGYNVCGSDNEIYPPMSTMLDELKIPLKTPYSPKNLNTDEIDMVVVANCLSKGHVEIEEMLKQNISYTSFPKMIGECFLKDRLSLVVAGTHGKTTTSSILTHALIELGENPGYMIGGVPRNFERSFNFGKGKPFVIEGDEYDTAWFDKESKFLHYQPNYLVFNNLEFDHADIFENLAAVEKMFGKFLDLAPKPENIIANIDDPGVLKLIKDKGIFDQVTKVSSSGKHKDADIVLGEPRVVTGEKGSQRWILPIDTIHFGKLEIDTIMVGHHNMANIGQVVGCLSAMSKSNDLKSKITGLKVTKAIRSFLGVQRRFDHLGSVDDIDVFEDFAHHPTAVGLMISSFRKAYPNRRLVVAFEPKNATARRNIFEKAYAEKLMAADKILIGKCPVDERIIENERMDVQNIQKAIGKKAETFQENEDLLAHLIGSLKSGDTVIFMSSGSFSGVQYRLPKALKERTAASR